MPQAVWTEPWSSHISIDRSRFAGAIENRGHAVVGRVEDVGPGVFEHRETGFVEPQPQWLTPILGVDEHRRADSDLDVVMMMPGVVVSELHTGGRHLHVGHLDGQHILIPARLPGTLDRYAATRRNVAIHQRQRVIE